MYRAVNAYGTYAAMPTSVISTTSTNRSRSSVYENAVMRITPM
jgi:hypothetical protein